MDEILNQALSGMFSLFILFLFFSIVVIFFKSPYFKGKIGEGVVNLGAKLKLDSSIYHLLKDVTLPTKAGTTQVDHIIISIYGIFVIETKNMKGWIFGGEHQKMWAQKIYKHSNKFQNPLHQNYKHVKTVSEIVDVPESKVFSIVVFIGESSFKTVMPTNVLDKGYTGYIKSKREILLSKSDVESIIKKLNSSKLESSFKTNRDHVKHLKSIHESSDTKSVCPKCDGSLVKRVIKKGVNKGQEFYGCQSKVKMSGFLPS